jgi:hypothetical protein
VEQTATGKLVDSELLVEVYSSPTAIEEEDHMAGLQAECRLGGTWAKRN